MATSPKWSAASPLPILLPLRHHLQHHLRHHLQRHLRHLRHHLRLPLLVTWLAQAARDAAPTRAHRGPSRTARGAATTQTTPTATGSSSRAKRRRRPRSRFRRLSWSLPAVKGQSSIGCRSTSAPRMTAHPRRRSTSCMAMSCMAMTTALRCLGRHES